MSNTADFLLSISQYRLSGVCSIVCSVIAIVLGGVVRSENIFEMSDVLLFQPENTLQFFGVVTFTFTIHYCVLSMGEEVLVKEKDIPLTGPITTMSTGGLTKPLTTAYFWSAFCICALGK